MTQLSHIVVALTLMALAVFVWRANPGSKMNRRFAFTIVLFSLWVIGIAGLQTGRHLDQWGAGIFAVVSFIPITALSAVEQFQSGSRAVPHHLRLAGGLAALLFAAAAIGTDLIVYDTRFVDGELTRATGPLYTAFVYYFVAGWLVVAGTLFFKWRSARGLVRVQVQYFGVGMVTAAAGAICANLILPLVTGRSTYSWVGPYFSLVFIAWTTHAIIRHRLMDLRLVVHRGLTLAIAIVLSLAPVVFLLFMFWARLSEHLGRDELFLFLVASVFVALLTPPTRDIARRLLDRYVYRTHANYQRTVREASRMLTGVLDLNRLLPFISNTIVGSTGVEGAAIYLRGDRGFSQAMLQKRSAISYFEGPDPAPDAVVAALDFLKEPLVADELATKTPTQPNKFLNDTLTSSNWALVLPIQSDAALIGLIAVGPKLSGDAFYPEDLDLLMTLANQAGIAIKNARLYAEVILANEYVENIVETIESGVVAITGGGRIAIFNRAAQRITGQGDLEGERVQNLAMWLQDPLLSSIGDGQPQTLPEIAVCVGNVVRPVMCTTSPLHGPSGVVLGAVAVFSDLTALKQLEIERRRAEKLAYFEILASGIAHEIKNPLVAIKTFTQLLPRRRDDPRFFDEFGRIVGREIQRMERLVDRLRTLAREEQRPRAPVDLRLPLIEAMEFMQASFDEKGLRVTAMLGEVAYEIVGDHESLEELFLNLLMNANDATPPGGSVTVSLTCDTEQLSINIADSGTGIAPEILERVFEPFFTTKQHGTGLGLAISAGIAQSHGGRLRATNGRDRGAIFTVDLPVAAIITQTHDVRLFEEER